MSTFRLSFRCLVLSMVFVMLFGYSGSVLAGRVLSGSELESSCNAYADKAAKQSAAWSEASCGKRLGLGVQIMELNREEHFQRCLRSAGSSIEEDLLLQERHLIECRGGQEARPPEADARDAKGLVQQGVRLVQNEQYPEALQKFQAALDLDAGLAQAHYQMARTLCLLRDMGKVCEHDAYQSTIMEYLTHAVKLEPALLGNAKNDNGFRCGKKIFSFHILLGRSVKNPKDIRMILQEVNWYGPSPGAYGPMSGVSFHPDGRAEFWVLEFGDDQIRRVRSSATWSLRGTRIRVRHQKSQAEKPVVEAILGEDGKLVFEDGTAYTDDPDDCSA